MKPIYARLTVAVMVGALVLCPRVGRSQTTPAFELQPGIAVSEFVSVPEGTVTNTAFTLRFSTRFPTNIRWLTPVVGATFLPYGSTQNTIRNTDAPTLFAGNIFPLLAAASTAGWFSIEVPLLIAHSPGAGPSGNVRDYGRDLVIVPTAYLHFGARALSEFGRVWSRLTLVASLEQNLTPNVDLSTGGGRDFFNPTATIGISFRVGPN